MSTTPHVQYRHFRLYGGSLRDLKPLTKGGMTMAFVSPKQLDDLTENDTVKLAFAFCSKDDVYCRAAGRSLSAMRLLDGQTITVPGDQFRIRFYQDAIPDILKAFRRFCLTKSTHDELTGAIKRFS